MANHTKLSETNMSFCHWGWRYGVLSFHSLYAKFLLQPLAACQPARVPTYVPYLLERASLMTVTLLNVFMIYNLSPGTVYVMTQKIGYWSRFRTTGPVKEGRKKQVTAEIPNRWKKNSLLPTGEFLDIYRWMYPQLPLLRPRPSSCCSTKPGRWNLAPDNSHFPFSPKSSIRFRH